MQVRVHEVEHQVYVAVVLGADHILQADDILVPGKLLQEDDLAEGALGVGRILECVKVLLKGHDLLGLLINGLPHDTVGALT